MATTSTSADLSAVIYAAEYCDAGNAQKPVYNCAYAAVVAASQCPGINSTDLDPTALACACTNFNKLQGCFKNCPTGLDMLNENSDFKTVSYVCSSKGDSAGSSSSGGGLSTGAIAGIVVGVGIVIVAAFAVGIFCLMKSRKGGDGYTGAPKSSPAPMAPAPVIAPATMPIDASYYSYPGQDLSTQQHQQPQLQPQQMMMYQPVQQFKEKESPLFGTIPPPAGESQLLPQYATPSQFSNPVALNNEGSHSSIPSVVSTNPSYSQIAAPGSSMSAVVQPEMAVGPGALGAALPGYNAQMANGAAYVAPVNEKEFWKTN